MKKKYTFLLLAIIAFLIVMADNTVKVLKIYSEDNSTTIPMLNIGWIYHSKYDLDSMLNSEYVTSIIWSIDSIYKTPINEIDSLVVTNVDTDIFKAQIDSIQDYILAMGNIEVKKAQTELEAWLSSKSWVKDVAINDSRNLITITFENGLDYSVFFQNMSFFYDYETSEINSTSKRVSEYFELFPYFDVSSQDGEEIIEKNKIMYIQGHDFHDELTPYFFEELAAYIYPKFIEHDLSVEEQNRLNNEITSSPLNIELKTIPYSLLFLDEDFSDYGLVLIGQTHGASNVKGAFMVDDVSVMSETGNNESFGNDICLNRRAWLIYTIYNNQDEELIIQKKNEPAFWIHPSLFANMLNDSKAIVFGNYCYSYGLANYLKRNTILGYKFQSSYKKNTEYLVYYVYNMLLGRTHEEAMKQIKDVLGDYFFVAEQSLTKVSSSLFSNHNNSKQRFFSISTNDVSQEEYDGNIIITGKINGYNNLKNDIMPVVYLHEGDGTFTPESNGVQKISGDFIKPDGTFEYEYTGDLQSGKKYGIIIGFEYGSNVYYGEVKFFEKQDSHLCPDDNHPHMIDLGLPSGTCWSCCNVGASSPEQFGNSLSWDAAFVFLPEKEKLPSSKQGEELLEKCAYKWSKQNGNDGYIVTGPNGNSLFLPAAGTNNTSYAEKGGYWLMKSNSSQASCFIFSDSEKGIYNCEKRQSMSVRSVASQTNPEEGFSIKNTNVTDVSSYEATLNGNLYISKEVQQEYEELLNNIELGFVYGTDEEKTLTKMHWIAVGKLSELSSGSISVKISNLEADRRYHYSIITKEVGREFDKYDVLDDEINFETLCNCYEESEISFVDENYPDNSYGALVSVTNAQLNTYVNDGFCKKHHKVSGFYVNTSGNPNSHNARFIEEGKYGLDGKKEKIGEYHVFLNNLNKGTHYYFRPVCIVDGKEYLGVSCSFMTPDVETLDATKNENGYGRNVYKATMQAKHIHNLGPNDRYISTTPIFAAGINRNSYKYNRASYLYRIGLEFYWIDEETQEKIENSHNFLGHDFKGCMDTSYYEYPDIYSYSDEIPSFSQVNSGNRKVTLYYRAYIRDFFDGEKVYGKQNLVIFFPDE